MAAATPAPPAIRTYQQYYADASMDPHSGDYRPLLSEFWSENNPPTSRALYDLVTSADTSRSSAFLSLRQDGNDVFFQVIHSISKYPAVIGRPSPWDGKAYASVGDVVNGMITTVDLRPTAFDLSHDGLSQNVPNTMALARELLTQSPDLDFLGPFPDADAQITTVRTRRHIPLPLRYVNLFLDREVKVREGFIDMSNLMETQGDDVSCPELRDWLLLAITHGSPDNAPHLAQPPPPVPMADCRLLAHRLGILHLHLPRLRSPAGEGRHLDSLVGELVQEQRLSWMEAIDRANAAQAPKTVAKALGAEVVNTLLAVIGVEAEESLPSFWREVAQAGKRDCQALEQALLRTARDLSLADASPVVTPDLVKRATGLQWAGLLVDDLSEGIQPFSIILPDYVGSEVGVEAQRLAETYAIMTGTQTTASLKDAQTVKTGKAVIPKDFGEARAHLVALMLVWTVLLGDSHPFVFSLGQFLKEYTSREYSLQNKLRNLGTQEPPAALLLRYVQLHSVTYWRQALTNRSLPSSPRFDEVLDKLDMHDRSWIPAIPQKYWKPHVNTGKTPLGSVVSGLTFPSSVGSSASGSQGVASSAGSTSAEGSRSKKDTDRQTKAENPGVNRLFDLFQDAISKQNFRVAMAKGGPPPTVERAGQQVPMCLSYHLGGACWSGCSRNADHGPHSEDEDNLLLNWCQTTYGS